MDWKDILYSLAALVFVLSLVGVAALIAKRLNLGGISASLPKAAKKRLQVKEVLNIDAKRKLVLVTRDDKEHLIAFSENGVRVIEEDIRTEDVRN